MKVKTFNRITGIIFIIGMIIMLSPGVVLWHSGVNEFMDILLVRVATGCTLAVIGSIKKTR